MKRDIFELELLTHKLYSKFKTYCETVQKPAFNMVVKVGYAVVKPTHEYNLYHNYTYWEYVTLKNDGIDYILFNWIPEPDNKINEEIGTFYYQAEQRKEILCRRYYRVKEVLLQQLNTILYERRKSYRKGDIVKIVLNGREFFYEIYEDVTNFNIRLFHDPYGKEIHEINLDD